VVEQPVTGGNFAFRSFHLLKDKGNRSCHLPKETGNVASTHRAGLLQASPAIGPPPAAEGRAILALILAIAAVVLVWPLGIVLGPAAFWVGVSAVRRINRAPRLLTGAGRARIGAIIGAVVSGMYLFWILADVVAIFMLDRRYQPHLDQMTADTAVRSRADHAWTQLYPSSLPKDVPEATRVAGGS
jgi:hypothetical protein